MVTYEYRCRVCGHEFEVEQNVKDAALTECPTCKVCALYRLVSGVAFTLKGDCWASDGYTSKKT